MTIEIYKNQPSPKLLNKIGATNLTVADAIAEIVANSFDAAAVDEPTRIDVDISQNIISIIDNGVGMSKDVLIEAVRLGVDMTEYVSRRSGAKGTFGLGMKTACASMGRWWAIYTRPENSSKEYRVAFDLAEWEKRPDSEDAWTIELEEIDADFSGPLGERQHGTAVLIKKLRTKNIIPGAVLKKIGEAFKPHLEEGDIITVNGDPAKPHEYHFVPDSKTPIDVSFEFDGTEYRITGWVGIDTQTHNDGHYGFNVYRHNQLVQTWNQDWFRAHLMTSRIIGEVHMDFIEATFFKQGLQQSALYAMASGAMKVFMTPVAKASNDLSKKGNINIPAKRSEIVRKMHADVDPDEISGSDHIDEDNPPYPATEPSAHELPKLEVSAEELILGNGRRIALSSIEYDMKPEGPAFDYVFDDDSASEDTMNLQAVLNTSHPLFTESKDRDQLRKYALADSILRCLTDTCEMNIGLATETRNRWLLASFNGQDGQETL